ncbi:hypothetical protein DVG78_26135 [Runella aurantiaca]|uniref:Uncharacterized protein n=1 Tax=Runella aurantiaca TaxID=2282308 RepID=A0A369HZM7_9BACT|nr:glycosylhydrolase-like jelly roll fold domain-containing protein [Runella aurantiaca]RDB02949.1 hypothetical protein DVG78_26135 [Runella aurantiaca]
MTNVKLHLEPQESVFVVVQKTTSQKEYSVEESKTIDLGAIRGSWAVHFPENWGAPKQVTLNELTSWHNHPDEGVKYFSGTAVYSKEFKIKKRS